MCTEVAESGLGFRVSGLGDAEKPRAEVVSDDATAISVRNVGKRYDIYSRNIDRLKHILSGGQKSYGTPFWALRECSFEVQCGEAVGIVGRNGSGKSTLMQIIAGTLSPTEGEVHIRGRISALLELGSGFNPQFTGRENVYLSGSILGLNRRQMDEKFDAIASFADIGEFLDQPVEVYSSGMHARLAFSVSVCVEPDILIVDEILSVGDAGFQQKCVGRMKKMLGDGLTLLFVSHSADMVKSICTRGLYLEHGKTICFGPASTAVDKYMQSLREQTTDRAQQNLAIRKPELAKDAEVPLPPARAAAAEESDGLRYGAGQARIESVRLVDETGAAREGFNFGERVIAEVVVGVVGEVTDINRLDLIFVVRDKAGVDIFGTTVMDEGTVIGAMKQGEKRRVRVSFVNTLAAGPHGIALTLTRRPDYKGEGLLTLDHMDAAAAFESVPGKRKVRGKVSVGVRVEIG